MPFDDDAGNRRGGGSHNSRPVNRISCGRAVRRSAVLAWRIHISGEEIGERRRQSCTTERRVPVINGADLINFNGRLARDVPRE